MASGKLAKGKGRRGKGTDLALAGKVAIITGASRGIGLAIAQKLGEMGAKIAICARSAANLERAAAGLRKHGIPVLLRTADVTRDDEILELVHEARSKLGPIDILVNNAGVGEFGPFYQQSEADWDKIVNTNLKAAFLLSRAVAPEMIGRKSGHIINISSLAGKNTFANGALYCASKWGLQGLSGCMAEDLRAYGIRVSTICPGTVATEFSAPSSPSGTASPAPPGPAARDDSKMLQPDDVAHVVVALLTQSDASFISEVQLRPLRKS